MIKNLAIAAAICIAIGLCAAIGGTYFVTKILVDVAMDRELPKIIAEKTKDIPVSEHIAEVLRQVKLDEERLLSEDTKTVSIRSRDGLRLVGHLHSCKNPKRVIVAMHGWRSSWARDFGPIADFWYENDCIVLFPEQRAQGQSEGEHMCFGLMERYDCLDWVNFINEYTGGELPVYLGGISMGATTVLMAAGLELPQNVKAILADCAFTSAEDIWQYVVKNDLHLSYGRLRQIFANRISKQKTGLMPNEYSTIKAMEGCKIPVLFIHGSGDSFVPVEMTHASYEACVSKKQKLIVPRAEHGMSYIEDKNAYEEAVKNTWSSYDN